MARPYLKSHLGRHTGSTSRYEMDPAKLLGTPINVPLGALMGYLPRSWWEARLGEAEAAQKVQKANLSKNSEGNSTSAVRVI